MISAILGEIDFNESSAPIEEYFYINKKKVRIILPPYLTPVGLLLKGRP